MIEYFKEQSTPKIFKLIIIHDDDDKNQRYILNTTYQHVISKWKEYELNLAKLEIDFKTDRVFDEGKSFDYVISSLIGKERKEYSCMDIFKNSKKESNKQFFNIVMREMQLDNISGKELVIKLHSKMEEINSNHKNILKLLMD